VTNYFVLTYDTPGLARGVPKTSWDRIISLSCEFALVLTLSTLVPFLLKWGCTPILFFALGFCPHSHALDEPQGTAGILPEDQSEESTAGKMPAAPWRRGLTCQRFMVPMHGKNERGFP